MRLLCWRTAGRGHAGTRSRVRALLVVLGVTGSLHVPGALAGQARVEDLVISAGVAGEAWRGDFTALNVPQIDSTETAVAWVGEWSANGIFTLLARGHSRLEATLDAGFRQFATGGFRLRNYAPREHSGTLTTSYRQKIAGGRGGELTASAQAQTRGIADRPPMPLYLAPGYDIYRVTAGYARSIRGLEADFFVTREEADFTAPDLLPNLDLLDRSSVNAVAGAGRRFYRSADPDEEYYWGFRLFGAYRHHSYPKQGLGILRVDNAIGMGGTYKLVTERFDLSVTLDGTRSRSNSRRVEYNAGRLEMQLHVWEFWRDLGLNVAGTLARKRYIDPGQDALVPGEEADNESSLYAEITRSLGRHVNGAFRLGWQRVETNFSDAYYTRFGGAFFLRVRPMR